MEKKTQYGWIVERNTKVIFSQPQYLIARGGMSAGHLKFAWCDNPHSALRFAQKEDAKKIALIAETLQPELFYHEVYDGPPKCVEHGFDK